MEEKRSIEKLDTSNWDTWKFQVCHLLLPKGLWKYVDGSEMLPEDVDEGNLAEFYKKSRRVPSTLAMAIKTPQLYLVTAFDSPKDVWEALK